MIESQDEDQPSEGQTHEPRNEDFGDSEYSESADDVVANSYSGPSETVADCNPEASMNDAG